MYKRNRRLRAAKKRKNKIRSLLHAMYRSYLKSKGGKVKYGPDSVKDLQHLTDLVLDHFIRQGPIRETK